MSAISKRFFLALIGLLGLHLVSCSSTPRINPGGAAAPPTIKTTPIFNNNRNDAPKPSKPRTTPVGNDRPGIVSQLAKVISQAGANIEDLNTSIESAAMAGHPIFHASGIVCLPDSTEDDELVAAIESLSDDLNVEIGMPVK